MKEESGGYAPGDRVEITKNPMLPNDPPGWVPDMNKHRGKILTLEKHVGNGDWKVKETRWTFNVRWFKLIKKEK